MANIISPLFVIGVLIFVHELGHFIVAKLRKVRVEKFSLGFGPEIIGAKLGETRYILSLIPLGGYVKMAGDSLEEERKGEPYEYLSKGVKERLSIVASGPLMNILFSAVIFAVLFNIGLPYMPARIGTVLKDSPAEGAGLKSGDIIKRIEDKKVEDWPGLTKIIQSNPEKMLELEVEREGKEIGITVRPRFDEAEKIGLIGIAPHYGREVGRVPKNSAAYESGLREGDEIIEVSGKPVNHWNEIIELIDKEKVDRVSISVERRQIEGGSKIINMELSLKRDKKSGLPVFDFALSLPKKRYPFFISLWKAFSYTFYLIKIMYVGLWQLISGQVSIKAAIGGPLLIAQMVAQEAQTGLTNLFLFISIISLNLAVINFLPIPILDGGHILFLAIEGIRGRPLSRKIQEAAQKVGFAILIGIILFTTYNDILRFFSK